MSVRVTTVCGVTAAAAPERRHGRSEASFSDATPAEVRAALVPEEAAEFDQQWREVMAAATEALDLSEVLATLESWRRVARLTAATGPEVHRAMYRRAAGRLAGADIPAEALAPFTEARAMLEVAPWGGAPYHQHTPDSPMRALTFGPAGLSAGSTSW